MPRHTVTRLRWALACGLVALGWARDLKFKIDKANSCDDMIVQISAGNYSYPLILTVTPFQLQPQNITIPQDSNAPNGPLNVTVPQLPWEVSRQIIVSLSDQTGFASLGTYQTLTLGPSETGNKCNVTIVHSEFTFGLDSDLVQCKPYPFTGFTRATQPVKVFFQIPLGDSFAIQAPVTSVTESSYTWLANISAGTSIIFTMIDALGKNGGSSGARVVGKSSNSACLHGGGSGSGLSSGAITGIVITIVVLMFGALFTVIFLRKRRQAFNYYAVDLNSDNPRSHTSNNLPAEYQTTPFILPSEPESPPVSAKRTSTSTMPTSAHSATAHSPLPSPNPTTPGRLIVHRDITEDVEGEEGQVIELPPSYSARRAPIPGIPQTPIQATSPEAGPSSLTQAEKLGGRRRPR